MSRRASCGPADARERSEYAREQLTLAEIGHPWPTTAARHDPGHRCPAHAAPGSLTASYATAGTRAPRKLGGETPAACHMPGAGQEAFNCSTVCP